MGVPILSVEVDVIWSIALIIPSIILGVVEAHRNGDSSRPNYEFSESKDKYYDPSSPMSDNQPS